MTESESPATTEPGGSLRNELYWIIPGSIATLGLALFLLLNRRWGADAAAVLAIPVSIVGAVVPVLIQRDVFKRQVPKGPSRKWRLVAGFTTILLIATAVTWWIRREGDPFDYMSGEVRIGYVAYEYKGWHAEDPDGGGPAGFDVDLARHLEGSFPESRFDWVDLGTLDNRIAALQGGWYLPDNKAEQEPVKLVIANFSISQPRREEIDFAGPYFVDTQAFLSRDAAGSITEIPRGRVCAVTGSRSAEKLAQIGWKPVLQLSLAACVSEFRSGRVDAVSDDRSLIAGYATDLGLEPPRRLNYGSERYGVGIPNNMPRLCAELSRLINEFLEYSWSNSFKENLNEIGLQEKDYVRPPSADPCEPAAPWYKD
ncbi:glutamate transport system substrate-binding protein [Actinoplanes lutulentus]|uniref:ABC-type amino acid transport substrate-binding protein n=1 Tax=Actinoplanes lutulentus TaxID=1287878 RepID=A0A327Z573_9ACTN|nr:transporter substrate-binding domain-containing protein [Actinoplanes lutulentus]MBB2947524.1 glutamate transport system substrate-binding protein [Actinoplanes lutulentus]RAK25680.1 ABC-type amino acid transport substrate-binding protein [Actinoplanes lutulentus]